MTAVSFKILENVVGVHAKQYENALSNLESVANTSQGTGSSLSISQATLATTQVQVRQALSEMAAGIAKNAADHAKNMGRKVGS